MSAPIGNRNAAKAKIFSDALKRYVETDNYRKLNQAAEALVNMAIGGDIAAIKELADRLEGKPIQKTEVAGEDGGPVVIEILKFASSASE